MFHGQQTRGIWVLKIIIALVHIEICFKYFLGKLALSFQINFRNGFCSAAYEEAEKESRTTLPQFNFTHWY